MVKQKLVNLSTLIHIKEENPLRTGAPGAHTDGINLKRQNLGRRRTHAQRRTNIDARTHTLTHKYTGSPYFWLLTNIVGDKRGIDEISS